MRAEIRGAYLKPSRFTGFFCNGSMPKHNITLAIFFLTGSAIALLVLVVVKHNEVLSTTIQYLVEDASTDHGKKNLMLGSSSIRRLEDRNILKCGLLSLIHI